MESNDTIASPPDELAANNVIQVLRPTTSVFLPPWIEVSGGKDSCFVAIDHATLAHSAAARQLMHKQLVALKARRLPIARLKVISKESMDAMVARKVEKVRALQARIDALKAVENLARAKGGTDSDRLMDVLRCESAT